MDSPHRPPTRNQQIFTLGLGVEAVSLYLLCCSLLDAGQELSLATISPTWNLSHNDLIANLEILLHRGILAATGEAAADTTRFRVQPEASWRPPGRGIPDG